VTKQDFDDLRGEIAALRRQVQELVTQIKVIFGVIAFGVLLKWLSN